MRVVRSWPPLPAGGVDKLAADGLEEVAAPKADQEQCSEEQYRVQAGPVSPSPIHTLLEIQPDSKFVQSESGADTVEQGHQAAGKE